MSETIAYGDLLARFAPEHPAIPVYRVVPPRILEVYLPDWTPPAKQEQVRLRVGAYWRSYTVQVCLVQDVPREALFGDWGDYSPAEDMS